MRSAGKRGILNENWFVLFSVNRNRNECCDVEGNGGEKQEQDYVMGADLCLDNITMG